MNLLPQLIFTGIGIGSIYAMVALGFVLLIRAADVVNFAQGDFAMLGAFAMVVLLNQFGLPYWAAIIGTVLAVALFGILFAGVAYWPMRNRGVVPVIITTIGASIVIGNVVLALYGPSPAVVPPLFSRPGFRWGPVFMDSQYLAIMAVLVVMLLIQYFVFEKTLFGKKLQATSQDKEMADLLGIPIGFMILTTFAYSAALGSIAGVLVAPILFASVGMAGAVALKAFAANVIGGFGSIPGAIIGGLILGVAETLGAAFISVPYRDAVAFVILILVLLVRPQGLFGELIAEKA